MIKTYLKLLILLVAPLLFFTGCEEDEMIGDPEIVSSTTRNPLRELDLDETRGPNIRGWAVAPAGLESVTITAQRGGSTESLLNVTDFTDENSEMNGTRYNYNVYPEFTPDLTSVTITVTDVQGKTATLEYEVIAEGGEEGPEMAGFTSDPIEANVRANVDIRPAIEGTISSHWGLQSVTIYETYNGTEEEAEVITDFGDSPNSYSMDYVPDYDRGYTEGLTDLRVVAVDGRGNVSETSFDISVIDAQPRPEVTFDQEEPIEADLTATPPVEPAISGSVESFEDLASINFYLVRGGEDEHLQEITSFLDPNNYEFSINPEYGLGITDFKVVVRDAAGQTTTATHPINVIADDPDLVVYSSKTISAQGDRFTDNTLFNAAEGTVHHYEEPVGNEELARQMDFLLTDTNGENNWAMFSPEGDAWLGNNFYKGVEWPHNNTTKLRLVEGADEGYFNQATSTTIEEMEMGDDFVLRLNGLQPGNVVFFETENGIKGLMLFKDVLLDDGKNDDFSIDVKVVMPE